MLVMLHRDAHSRTRTHEDEKFWRNFFSINPWVTDKRERISILNSLCFLTDRGKAFDFLPRIKTIKEADSMF